MNRVFLSLLFLSGFATTATAQELHKTASTLYGADVAADVQQNVANDPWAASVRDRVVEAAEFWKNKSDRELWDMVFGPSINRSWMVWSNGYSPVTGESVPMYNWVMDAQSHPWKTQDPSSGEWFPKNDFKAFYDSGLNTAGLFDPALADRSLLFNADHPDPNDPLHLFGVDDGEGYVNEKGERWRFIGAYLIYGHWKQLIVSGVRVCSSAYLLTGDPIYAHKAGVLLDRVADVYPGFDFKEQGILYEGPGAAGYVSTWHDACEETRELVMGYDMVFDALAKDEALVAFLSERAAEAGLENPKATFADVQRNIEGRILRDSLANPQKIHSNYPRAEILKAITTAVLEEPDDAFWALVDPMMEQSTAVDGVTGEKGLAGYSCYTISALAHFLAEFSRVDPQFLPTMLERYPNLKGTYRFFMDTLCLGRYYPLIGDTGHYGAALDRYVGVNFSVPGASVTGGLWTILSPSNYRLFWDFYEATGDPGYVQVLYEGNGGKSDGLPYDIFSADGPAFQKQVTAVIAREGTLLHNDSVNFQGWRLGILRSGRGANGRALWLDYDSSGGHSHKDGMNLGLFSHGLDMMPEMGYPPVQFGGWGSDKATWYTKTAAHNTVLIDGKNQVNGEGETTLWANGTYIHAISARGEAMAGAERYERTAVLIDVDDGHFYVVDVFRVKGGNVHTKFQQSHFGELTTAGLSLQPAALFPDINEMRNHRLDPNAAPGWEAEWAIRDDLKLLTDDAARTMHYWDFTAGAAAGTSEAWIALGMYEGTDETWVPRLCVQREGDGAAPLESTFVAVLEPSVGNRAVAAVKRLPTASDRDVVLEVTLADGRRDLVAFYDGSDGRFAFGAPRVETDAALTWLRFDEKGAVENAAIANGTVCDTADFRLENLTQSQFAEFHGE